MKFLVDNGAPKSYFEEYTTFDISPHHIHKTKVEHKFAVLALAAGISSALAENSDIFPQTLSQRLKRLVARCKKDLR
jgi:hypothetical protein